MNIGPGNIEALLLDALEGRLSAADAELVWAALEAHPEWGVSWEFDDRELPRLNADDMPVLDWSGLKKEIATDEEIRAALRRNRDLHVLDNSVKQSLYRRQERSLWRYWAAAASVALIVWIVWQTARVVEQPIAKQLETKAPKEDSIGAAIPKIIIQNQQPAVAQEQKSKAIILTEHIAHEVDGVVPPEAPNAEEQNAIAFENVDRHNITTAVDTVSLEAPLQLPYDINAIPPASDLLAQHIKSTHHESQATPLTPRQWIRLKAEAITARATAEGTLPKVRRDKHSFEMQWGSLSINAH